MAEPRIIQVILPLKLGWEPFYILPAGSEDACVGDRVLVRFAGRSYLAVVSAVDCTPDIPMQSIKPIVCLRNIKGRILPSEIELWRALSSYYMCTVGEVYKVAYPSVKDENVSTRKKEAAVVDPVTAIETLAPEAIALADRCESSQKVSLLQSACSNDVLMELCLRQIRKGKSVLYLVPEVKLSKVLEKRARGILGSSLVIWGSNITPARKREAVRIVRSGAPYVVLGTRSAIFLPHSNLGLIVVQDEHEISYKQTSPAPRYNGRDAAVLLSSIHHAKVVLESETPSLESLLNVSMGKYELVCGTLHRDIQWEIVDVGAEVRKRGMRGDVSLRFVNAAGMFSADGTGSGAVAVYKPLRAAFPKIEELSAQVRTFFPDAFITDDLITNPLPAADSEGHGIKVLGVFGADALLGRQDFRADERLVHAVMQAVIQCGPSLRQVLVHTREASHPVFAALCSGDLSALMQERHEFDYPPFTRIVDMVFKDNFQDRADRMIARLSQRLGAFGVFKLMPLPGYGIRVFLSKDRFLASRKATLETAVAEFEKGENYASHIHFDVDPQ